MKKYNIVLKNNENFVLAQCNTLELAKSYLKEMKDTDKKLAKTYNWSKIPEYKIIESEKNN